MIVPLRCENCGVEVFEASNFCHSCGVSVRRSQYSPAIVYTRRAMFFLFVLTFLSGIWMLWSQRSASIDSVPVVSMSCGPHS